MWHHDVPNARTCQFFRRLFDRLPVRISTSDLHHRILRKKLYHIRVYDFGVQFSFNACNLGYGVSVHESAIVVTANMANTGKTVQVVR